MGVEYRAEICYENGKVEDKVFSNEKEAKAWAYAVGEKLTDVAYISIEEFNGNPFPKKGENSVKLHKKVADILAIINHMSNGLANSDNDGGEFYNTDFTIGFGDTDVYLECCANYFNAFEGALGNLLCAVIEEEGLDGEPYDSLYKQYEKFNKW